MRLYCSPQSRRLIVAVAEAPTRRFGPCLRGADGPSTVRVISFVTPCIVRSPVNLNLPGPSATARLDLNVAVGNWATSKKFGDFRSLSRPSVPVLTPVTSIVMSALRLSSDLPSYSTVPLTGPSVPRTVDTSRCFTLNPAAEWLVSTVHVLGPAAGGAGAWARPGA